MALDKVTLDEFKQITGFDLTSYYTDFVSFMNTDYNYIVDYFNGKTKTVGAQSFENLKTLLKEKETIFSLFTQSKNRLNNLKFWDLMIQLEEIDSSLMTVNNVSKWLRSPKTNTSYSTNIEINIGLRQNNTLEKMTKEVLREEDYQNEWVKTAVRNNLKEEDYSDEGGNLLAVTFSQTGNIFVAAVVDNINGENILGLDIDRKTTFVDNDLKVLQYKDTYAQSIYILSTLKVGDNPYIANDGIVTGQIIGSNLALLSLPTIFRQLAATFSTDDTIKSFSIVEVKREADAIFIIFAVTSVLGDISVFKHNLSGTLAIQQTQ